MFKGIKFIDQIDEDQKNKDDKILGKKTERNDNHDYSNNRKDFRKSSENNNTEIDYENLLESTFKSFLDFDNKEFTNLYNKLELFRNSRANKIDEMKLADKKEDNANGFNNNNTGDPYIDVDLDGDEDDDRLNPNIDELNFNKFKDDSMAITNQMKGELMKLQQFNQFEQGLNNVYYSKNSEQEMNKQLRGEDKEITKPSARKEKLNQTILASCEKCLGAKLNDYSIISQSDNMYLAYPYREGSIAEYHLTLSTKGHVNSQAALEENIYQELRNYIKSIVSFNLNRDMTTVLLEYSRSANFIGHFEIECVPIKHKLLEDARMYFKKAFLDQDFEWSTNKKLVDTTAYKGNLTKILNENFSYVNVDFNGQGGFLHVIEDERRFNQVFLKEILCPLLKLQVHEVKYPKKIGDKELIDIVERYKEKFKPYDWTHI
jgi:hypothetical protein